MTRRRWTRRGGTLRRVACLLAVFVAAPTVGEDAVYRATERLRVSGGEEGTYRLFTRPSRPELVLLHAVTGQRGLVDLERRRVEWWDGGDPGSFEDTVEVRVPSGAPRWSGSVALSGDEARFLTPDGRSLGLSPRPPLRGTYDRTGLLRELPSFGPRARAYETDESWLKRLSAVGTEETRVLVVFGSWCVACEAMLPRMLEIERRAGLRVDYLAVGPSDAEQRDPLLDELRVRRLPAAIVRSRGIEIGRLDGTDDFRRPERSLVRLLEGAR